MKRARLSAERRDWQVHRLKTASEGFISLLQFNAGCVMCILVLAEDLHALVQKASSPLSGGGSEVCRQFEWLQPLARGGRAPCRQRKASVGAPSRLDLQRSRGILP